MNWPMKWYTIQVNGFSIGAKESIEVPCPEVLPEPGDICIFTDTYETPGDLVYEHGDELHLMKRTDEAPYGKTSSLGNWLIISKFGVSVWSNIEWLLATEKLQVRQ